jgi:hypothetical protein
MAITKLMQNTVFNFHFFGLRFSVARSAVYGSGLVALIGALCAYFIGQLTPLDSVIAGILAMLLHWFGEIVHQYGHFLASKAVGHPMIGVRLWAIIGTSLYPPNEGELPAQTHIRRALGGPAISFLVLLLAILLWFLFSGYGGMLRFLLGWLIAEEILIYAIGALVPIDVAGFTVDGGTILYWLRKKQTRQNEEKFLP